MKIQQFLDDVFALRNEQNESLIDLILVKLEKALPRDEARKFFMYKMKLEGRV